MVMVIESIHWWYTGRQARVCRYGEWSSRPTILRGQTAFLLRLGPLQAGPPEPGDAAHVLLVLLLLFDGCANGGGREYSERLAKSQVWSQI